MALLGADQGDKSLSSAGEAALDAIVTAADGAGYDTRILEPIPADDGERKDADGDLVEGFKLLFVAQS
jgi:hypothetical protein